MEDLAGGSPEGSVYVDVEGSVHLLDVQLLPLHATRPEGIEVAVRIEQRSSTFFLKSENTLGFRQYSTRTAAKIPLMYFFSGNGTASAPISTFMCVLAIYIVPGSVYIFPPAE
jgi:hypothetical protein